MLTAPELDMIHEFFLPEDESIEIQTQDAVGRIFLSSSSSSLDQPEERNSHPGSLLDLKDSPIMCQGNQGLLSRSGWSNSN